ncbi:MAG: hypothetical protein PVG74_22690, partial [Desulfobacterales bacterium]
SNESARTGTPGRIAQSIGRIKSQRFKDLIVQVEEFGNRITSAEIIGMLYSKHGRIGSKTALYYISLKLSGSGFRIQE